LWWFVVVCGEFPVFPGFTPVLRVVSSGNQGPKAGDSGCKNVVKTWSKRGGLCGEGVLSLVVIPAAGRQDPVEVHWRQSGGKALNPGSKRARHFRGLRAGLGKTSFLMSAQSELLSNIDILLDDKR
jgi:hypothetical protein